MLGIGDDCAILRLPPGHELLVTTDFTLEGRHFLRDTHPPESVGHRALARGLSDIASMGGQPRAAFLSLALPPELLASRSGRRWIHRFFNGLQTLADRHKITLAGGDTAESPTPLILADIVLTGSAPAQKALRRSTARAGDLLYVTGALGGAAAELQSLLALTRRKIYPRQPSNTHSHPQLFPEPRIALGQTLLKRGLATAAIDLSDGLSTDLTHLCRASKLGAILNADALPLHPLTTDLARPEALSLALHGGEDYELLFTAAPTTHVPARLHHVPISQIGHLRRMRPSQPKIVLRKGAAPARTLTPGGWEHFRS